MATDACVKLCQDSGFTRAIHTLLQNNLHVERKYGHQIELVKIHLHGMRSMIPHNGDTQVDMAIMANTVAVERK